jgi:hypothetical protein
MGYEGLGFDAMHFHSWLCNHSPEKMQEEFGVRINKDGLFSSLSDGVRAADFLRKHGCSAIWEPWLVVNYSTQNLTKMADPLVTIR